MPFSTFQWCTLCPLWDGFQCEGVVGANALSLFGETLMAWMENHDWKLGQRTWFLACKSLWCRRNKWIFDRVWEPDGIFLNIMGRLDEDYGSYTAKIYGGVVLSRRQSSVAWVPLLTDIVKINMDASPSEEGWIVLGTVARNWKGEVLYAVVRGVRARWYPW